MEYEKIKQLIEDMGNSKLTSLDIEFPDGTKISAKKEKQIVTEKPVTVAVNEEVVTQKEESTENTDKKVPEGNVVKSPMVGTFYIKPSPDAEPYVEVGKQVNKGDVLCIIEAMKLMNEIESEFTGKVKEIYVKDGEPVGYGKPLFLIG